MATSVSRIGSDEDRTRFFRLSLIIIEELTQILRDLLHNEVPPTQIFKKVVKVNHLPKILRKDQIAIITDANTRGYQDFDITLLYTLLRNVCQNITPPSQNWGVSLMPSPNEVTVGDDIERIRLIRNNVFGRMTAAAISDKEYKEYWCNISDICIRMQTLLKKDYVKRLHDVNECKIDADIEIKYRGQKNIQSPLAGLDLLFDFLSRKLSPSDMSIFCTHILGQTQMAEQSRSRTNPSDTYYRILFKWSCREPTIDHKDKLRCVLSAMERQDLIGEMEGFSVDQFVYTGQIVGPEERISSAEFTAIASMLGSMYYHVVRFLGIEQRTIEHIEADYPTMKEQIYQCLLAIKRMKPGLTRQNICDALYYAEHADVIEKLNSYWKGS